MQVKIGDVGKFIVDNAWAVWVVLAIVLFVVPSSLGTLGLSPFRPYIAITFFAASAALLVQTVKLVRAWVTPKIKRRRMLVRLHARLHRMTVDEQGVLAQFILNQTLTQYLHWQDGIVVGLQNAQILYRSGAVTREGLPCSFNMQDWAYEYLTEHPELVGLDSPTEQLMESDVNE